MPSGGDLVRASDIMHRITATTRTTNLGGAVTVDTVLAIDAIFTLTRTRRVRIEVRAPLVTNTPSASNTLTFTLRKNTTGAAIATSDTAVTTVALVGGVCEAAFAYDELLTAGTYAYGPSIAGSGTTVNLNVAAGNPAAVTAWDMGDS